MCLLQRCIFEVVNKAIEIHASA